MKSRQEELLPYRTHFDAFLGMLLLSVQGFGLWVVAHALRSPHASDHLLFLTAYLALLSVVVLLCAYLVRSPPVVRFGVDGICLERFGRERLLPWAEFVAFEKTRRGIVALTTTERVPVGRSALHRESFAALVRHASRFRREHRAPRSLDLLDGIPQSEWGDVLKRALEGDFRTRQLTRAGLAEDLLHPDTPPALREVIAGTLQVGAKKRDIKKAVEATASMRSREAMKSALQTKQC